MADTATRSEVVDGQNGTVTTLDPAGNNLTRTSTIPPAVPAISTQDPGIARRPRDARLIHILLSSLGVAAYQERVPLQLLDFAYRHTSSIISDALHLSSDAYLLQSVRAKDAPASSSNAANGSSGEAAKEAANTVSLQALQLAISSRLQYQFSGGGGGGLGKEHLLEVAAQRNATALPRCGNTEWGIRLPAEKFVLSGIPWGLREDWHVNDDGDGEAVNGVEDNGDADMSGVNGADDEEGVDGEGVEGGEMADVFGEDADGDAMEE